MKHQQPFGLNIQCSALVLNFNYIFLIGHLYRAGQAMNASTATSPDVSGNLIEPSNRKKISKNMSQVLVKNVIQQLSEIQDGSLWFDQYFKEKINKLSDTEALTRPILQVHSVAEHISHILEWRKECLLRFKGQRTDLMNSADDWKDNIALSKIGWTNLKNLFYESTVTLINALKNQDDTYLKTKFLDTDYDFHYLIEGIIQHDLYHLGQIGVTIKLLNQK